MFMLAVPLHRSIRLSGAIPILPASLRYEPAVGQELIGALHYSARIDDVDLILLASRTDVAYHGWSCSFLHVLLLLLVGAP